MGGGGLKAFYWYQIFALDSAVVEVQEMVSSMLNRFHGAKLTLNSDVDISLCKLSMLVSGNFTLEVISSKM